MWMNRKNRRVNKRSFEISSLDNIPPMSRPVFPNWASRSCEKSGFWSKAVKNCSLNCGIRKIYWKSKQNIKRTINKKYYVKLSLESGRWCICRRNELLNEIIETCYKYQSPDHTHSTFYIGEFLKPSLLIN